MDSDESDSPPKKMAKIDANETKPRQQLMPVKMKNKLEASLDIITTYCLKQTKDHDKSGLSLFSNLTFYFTKVLNDDAINDWELDMHSDVKEKCDKLLKLCVFTMDEDLIDVLDALALLFDPDNKFHAFNATKISESVPPGSIIPDEKLYARPSADPQCPRGWLVDFINRFGELGGFITLLTRFQPARRSLKIKMICALLRPFRLCHELLTVGTIVKYFLPIVKRVQVILNTFTNEKLKEEAKNASISLNISATIESMKSFVSRVPEKEGTIQDLELLQLRLINRIQAGRNVHKLPAKLSSDINLKSLDRRVEYLQTKWKTDNDEDRIYGLESTLDAVKDDNNSARAPRLLEVLWDSALSSNVSTKVMEKALSTHVDILTYFSPQYHNTLLFDWLDKCVEEIKRGDKWTLPALMQIQKICEIYDTSKVHLSISAEDVVQRLNEKHNLAHLIINSFTNYMDKVRELGKANPKLERILFEIDDRYDHAVQVGKRLEVLAYLSETVGGIEMTIDQVKQIWMCLVEKPIFIPDRHLGFDLLYRLMDTNPIVKPESDVRIFFEQNILQLDPQLLTYDGILCVDHFFERVNRDDDDRYKLDVLIGVDYLWRVVMNNPDPVADAAFERLKLMNHNIGRQINRGFEETRRVVIAECTNRLQVLNITLSRLTQAKDINNEKTKKIARTIQIIGQVMKFLQDYINDECGWGEI